MKTGMITRCLAIGLVLSTAIGGTEAAHQMDLLIGKRPQNLKFDGRYLPKKQELNLSLKRRAKFFVRGQHDLIEQNGVGFGTALFSLRGGGRNLEVTVLQLGKGAKQDVTRRITGRPGLTDPEFMIDDQVDFLVKLKRRSAGSKRRMSRKLETIKIVGVLDSSDRSRDRVEARVRFR